MSIKLSRILMAISFFIVCVTIFELQDSNYNQPVYYALAIIVYALLNTIFWSVCLLKNKKDSNCLTKIKREIIGFSILLVCFVIIFLILVL